MSPKQLRHLMIDSRRKCKALTQVTAHCPKLARLDFCFDIICDDANVQIARDIDQTLHDHLAEIVRSSGQSRAINERSIFDDIDGSVQQMCERRIPSTELSKATRRLFFCEARRSRTPRPYP